MNSITVFCGSKMGADPEFKRAAARLGGLLAQNKIKIIYGGAKIGLMGAMADGCLKNGGYVHGVIPENLKKIEIIHPNLSRLTTTENMQQRKQIMMNEADAFVALPGGFGTLDEIFEVLTLSQLKKHQKPLGLLNINGYYDNLLAFLKTAAHKNLLRISADNELVTSAKVETLLEKLTTLTREAKQITPL